MASRPEFAKKHELTTLSDLAGFYEKMEGNIETFIDFEFSARPDGLPAMEKFYKLKIAKSMLMTGTPGPP